MHPTTGPDRIKLVAALVAVGAAALFFVATVAVVAGDDGEADAGDGDGEGSTWGGTPIDPALPRPDFTLTDTDGRPFDFAAETGGQLTLLFFGYTNCPDVCPVHMATLATALRTPGLPEPRVVFVTTDPERDTPERLSQWLAQFGIEGVVGLTGTVEEIAAAESSAQVAGSMIEPDGAAGDDGDYEVGHAAQMIAYSPNDQAHVVYPFGVRSEDWARDLPRLAELRGAAS
jgi:protein SCO1/2